LSNYVYNSQKLQQEPIVLLEISEYVVFVLQMKRMKLQERIRIHKEGE